MTQENGEDADSGEQEMYQAGRRDMALEFLAMLGHDTDEYADASNDAVATFAESQAEVLAEYRGLADELNDEYSLSGTVEDANPMFQ